MINLPNPDVIVSMKHWNNLNDDDKSVYLKMRSQFLNQLKSHSKDRKCLTFSNEVLSILTFVDRSPDNREDRAIVSGLAFAGPFVCVNTRQLKSFIGRCKSSINGSFQQIGYLAVKTKAKAKECICTFLPSLQNDPGILRQWTIRYCKNSVFVSQYQPSKIPSISDDDLYEDKRKHNNNEIINLPSLSNSDSPLSPLSPVSPEFSSPQLSPPPQSSNNIMFEATAYNTQYNIMNEKPLVNPNIQLYPDNSPKKHPHKKYNFDMSYFKNMELSMKIPEIKPSFSFDYLAFEDEDDWNIFEDSPLSDVSSKTMPRSQSTSLFNDWSWPNYI